jgi:hypothetical protein
MARGGSKPGERRGGRKRGKPNRITADLKAAILGALDENGGQAYLSRVAAEDPKTFCALLARVLPMTVAGDTAKPIIHEVRYTVVDPKGLDGVGTVRT